MPRTAKPKPKPKMKWKPAPPELIRLFEHTIQEFPQAQVRKMFGYPAAFINGNMASGLFQDSMVLRLSASDHLAIREQAGAKAFEPMGRVMREYVVVPETILRSRAQLKRWLTRALTYVGSLPAKQAKSRGKKTEPPAQP